MEIFKTIRNVKSGQGAFIRFLGNMTDKGTINNFILQKTLLTFLP